MSVLSLPLGGYVYPVSVFSLFPDELVKVGVLNDIVEILLATLLVPQENVYCFSLEVLAVWGTSQPFIQLWASVSGVYTYHLLEIISEWLQYLMAQVYQIVYRLLWHRLLLLCYAQYLR